MSFGVNDDIAMWMPQTDNWSVGGSAVVCGSFANDGTWNTATFETTLEGAGTFSFAWAMSA